MNKEFINRLTSAYIIFLLITAGFTGMLIFEGVVDKCGVSAGAPLFAGGDGSAGNPYQISNVTELQWMGNISNLNKHFVLINDINASATKTWNSGAGFDPIGDNSNYFQGTLDGKGFNITGLFINRGSTRYVGLFGYIGSGGLVSNVSLIDNNISGDDEVGELVGYNSGNVENCYASSSVRGNDSVGGLVGWNHGTVDNCYATGDVSGDGDVGGLVGWNWETVSNCYATGNVSSTFNCVGGLIGYMGWSEEGTVENCYATGNVSGNDSVGGLVGYSYKGTVENCYATGDVNGSSGLAGSWEIIMRVRW